MRLSNWFIICLLCAVGLWAASANSAELTGFEYPYWVLNDNGVIRYCMIADETDTTLDCWAGGNMTVCKLLTPAEGFIDCKDND